MPSTNQSSLKHISPPRKIYRISLLEFRTSKWLGLPFCTLYIQNHVTCNQFTSPVLIGSYGHQTWQFWSPSLAILVTQPGTITPLASDLLLLAPFHGASLREVGPAQVGARLPGFRWVMMWSKSLWFLTIFVILIGGPLPGSLYNSLWNNPVI